MLSVFQSATNSMQNSTNIVINGGGGGGQQGNQNMIPEKDWTAGVCGCFDDIQSCKFTL